MAMESGMCFTDQMNPHKYVFVHKSNYHVRFDFFKNGTKCGVVLLPVEQLLDLTRFITDRANDNRIMKKRYLSEVGKQLFVLQVNRLLNKNIKMVFESYKTIKCTIYLNKESTKHFVQFLNND